MKSFCVCYRIIEHLYNEKDLPNETITTTRAIHYRNKYLKNIFNTSLHNSLFDNRVLKNLPKPYNSLNLKTNYVVEQCLSRVVIYLSQKLLVPSCKYAAVSYCFLNMVRYFYGVLFLVR